MNKNLSDILKEVESLNTGFSKVANMDGAPVDAQSAPQETVVPQGSPEEQAIMAEQAQLAQAEASANMVNAAIAAEKKKEDAITNAAAALVSAEQSKADALATLNQVAAEAINAENMAIAKEASEFGAIAGAAMADSFYNNMYTNNAINSHYTNAYTSTNNLLKQASYVGENENDVLVKISSEAYDLTQEVIQFNALAANAYNNISNIIYK